MNYNKTINLAQKSEQLGNCIENLTIEIEKDGIDKHDINWILSRIEEIKQYQIEIQKVLRAETEF